MNLGCRVAQLQSPEINRRAAEVSVVPGEYYDAPMRVVADCQAAIARNDTRVSRRCRIRGRQGVGAFACVKRDRPCAGKAILGGEQLAPRQCDPPAGIPQLRIGVDTQRCPADDRRTAKVGVGAAGQHHRAIIGAVPDRQSTRAEDHARVGCGCVGRCRQDVGATKIGPGVTSVTARTLEKRTRGWSAAHLPI